MWLIYTIKRIVLDWVEFVWNVWLSVHSSDLGPVIYLLFLAVKYPQAAIMDNAPAAWAKTKSVSMGGPRTHGTARMLGDSWFCRLLTDVWQLNHPSRKTQLTLVVLCVYSHRHVTHCRTDSGTHVNGILLPLIKWSWKVKLIFFLNWKFPF